MTSTITIEQQQAIHDKVFSMTLPAGLGSEEAACSVAAINLALTGELTDRIPPCMSAVIGRWIIRIQDRMPAEIRNSEEWKSLLPLAAGTGRTNEAARSRIVLDWMWEALILVQPVADKRGFGPAWKRMTDEKSAAAADDTYAAAWVANAAANAAADAAAERTTWAAANAATWVAATNVATWAANAVSASSADADLHAADAAEAAAWAAWVAANAAAEAAAAADLHAADAAAAEAAAEAATWDSLDPCGLLKRLIEVGF